MTSPYFNNFKNYDEQELIEDLVIESIHIYGQDVRYIPRVTGLKDEVLHEDTSAEYIGNYPVEMYVRSVDGYGGDGEFLAKFGIEVRHQITFTVAIKTFKHMVGNQLSIKRPLEGALIYFEMNNQVFEIKKVEQYNVFFQGGTLQSYDLTCELFEYAGEKMDSGIPAVDDVEDKLSTSTEAHALRDINGALILDIDGNPQFDPSFDMEDLLGDLSDNEELESDRDGLIDATDDNIMSEDF